MQISSVGGIQAELAVRLNEVSADEADVYLNWINLITRDIQNSLTNTRYLEASDYDTLSSGTRNYSLPSDFGKMYSVTIPQYNAKLTYIPKQQFDSLYPSATEQGTPRHYTIYEEDIEFAPTPNDSIDVYYKYSKDLTTVSAASAALPIPTAFLELYVNKGVQYGLERRGDYEQALVMERRYDKLLEKMDLDMKSAEMTRMRSGREFRKGTGVDDKLSNFIG